MDVGLPHGPSVAPVRSGLYLPQVHALNQATRSSWWTSYASLTKTRSPFEIFLVPTVIRSVCYNAHCSSTDYKVTSLVFHRKSWSISYYSSGYIYEYTYPPDALRLDLGMACQNSILLEAYSTCIFRFGDTTREVFSLIGHQFCEGCSRPLSLECGDSSSYVSEFSSGADLIISTRRSEDLVRVAGIRWMRMA